MPKHQNDNQRPRYGHGVPDDRAEFAQRRAAAMPGRHAARLRNLAASGDARRRLADNPVFAPLFSDAQREDVQPAQRGESAYRHPLFSDTQGGGHDA